MSAKLARLLAPLAWMLVPGCGRDRYDATTDASFDPMTDATTDAGIDATIDAEARDDGGNDAGTIPPIDLRPSPLSTADWALRGYVSVEASGCMLDVAVAPTGGNPGDRLVLTLSGCPSHATPSGDFVVYLEYLPFHLPDAVGSDRFCRIDVSLDGRVDSVAEPTGDLLTYIGITAQLDRAAPGMVTSSWPSVTASTSPGPFSSVVADVGASAITDLTIDPTQPIYLTLGFRRSAWINDASAQVSLDNPHFHIVFDSDGDRICDDRE
ncbi:MAG: hypothetical protein K1X94_26565 [Sandaracinaceae bacterium]|nr:hypothetical protein [Sandaracinaceae bacterium]